MKMIAIPRPLYSLLLLLAASWATAQEPPRVEAVRVAERPVIETVPLTGSVTAEQRSLLSPQVAGLVSRLAVDTGDRVNAGDLLLELDPELVRIDRDQAAADLASAQAQWEDSERQLNEARSLRDGAIAASDIRRLEAEERVSRANRDAAQARLRRLEAELERHQVRAPFDGVVSSRQVDLGEWVSPGNPLMELVASAPLRVHFQVPQRYFPSVSEQSSLALRFDAYPDTEVTGRVHRKVPLSETGARTFLLRVTPPDDAPPLIPGLSTSGLLELNTERTGLSVPRDALIRYPDGRVSVWVVTEAEQGQVSSVREQQVTPGISASGRVEIRSGLSSGDVVVTLGNEALQEGQDVLPERIVDGAETGKGGDR
ncbi:efflux RND transporter periplasmic adaptor subunit [Marinimicrobium sp. C6131]|uniref:efflux RND transporter periplasmic adaptor subunit n=1 Tax=Marinimicrobium sp. C6131 TaxID=3022676 RepID=UPI00223E2149|nr:efflux RND transporter periplasmic adaptor subunit [Marinimicrobium sp. C6131]UZJ45417.1 efflux RND transporter periplasmic adaptor subunit [Marinimicrobium sp. C6131]